MSSPCKIISVTSSRTSESGNDLRASNREGSTASTTETSGKKRQVFKESIKSLSDPVDLTWLTGRVFRRWDTHLTPSNFILTSWWSSNLSETGRILAQFLTQSDESRKQTYSCNLLKSSDWSSYNWFRSRLNVSSSMSLKIFVTQAYFIRQKETAKHMIWRDANTPSAGCRCSWCTTENREATFFMQCLNMCF